jgi:hypothetical protein
MPISYRKSENTGLTQRCANAYISNAEGSDPMISFGRQLVIEAGGHRAFKELPACHLALTKDTATTEFEWIKAIDDSSTGKTLTYADLYDIIYSLAKSAMEAQDARDIIQEQITELTNQLQQP